MKKTITNTIALTVFAIMIESCTTSHKLNKFMGVWKRIDKNERDTAVIKKEDHAIVGILGKDTCIGIYDKKRNVLKFYVWGKAGVVTYNEKNDHIYLNNGEDGDFVRLK